ncbi:enoyl-CoA hydratase/isomerase family protein [Ruixingdingia sedimenti]|uniref:Enoyl-CoA hydratase/isomerase family protein n=1 Tax=Ruixingdingia sedimenti TaxID=3073604 RepID=A0ABU1F6R1_9RHOB|nr:enoyl-CoA hydratase/isomerase family protein [Xinfangfangia sp. LG-4]MDR5652560.1 enoyl-CoA hydratase/isomerase family protein [Xinfangfangia sp. LG-4]
MTDTVLVTDLETGVRLVTIDRPARLNALDGATLAALHDAIATATDTTRVIVIRGTGRAFCAGNDLKWLASGVLDDLAAHMRHQDLMQRTWEMIGAAPQVVIASVNGLALAGGFELALACDIIVADAAAEMGDEHLRKNLLPSGGSTQRLPRKIGQARAMYYLLTGRRMTGAEAERIGLAALAVPGDRLEEETLALATEIARTDRHALAAMKATVRRGLELPLSEGLGLERWMQYRYRNDSPALVAAVKGFAGKG